MVRPELPPEVWEQVILHLRRPLPRPNGRSLWSDVAQGDLVRGMRVCKLFNNLIAKVLYQTAITCQLDHFTYNIGAPAAARGISSKTQLIALVQNLHLEYCPKVPPHYVALMVGASFDFVEVEPYLFRMCMAEAEWMEQAVDRLWEDGRTMLSNCRTVSTSAFLGGQTEIWEKVYGLHAHIKERLDRTCEAIATLIAPPTVLSFCQHAEFGPLAYAGLLWDRKHPDNKGEAYRRDNRVHFGGCIRRGPSVVGGRSIWYCPDVADVPGFGLTGQLADALLAWVAVREKGRVKLEKDGLMRETVDAKGLAVDIYLPKAFLIKEGKRKIEKRINSFLAHSLKEMMGAAQWEAMRTEYVYQWRMLTIENAPPCNACSWCVDDI